jgi:hypothetical protein
MSAGFSFFPKVRSDGHRRLRDFTPPIQMRRCRQLQAQEFVATGCEAISDTASQRPQKIVSNKTRRKKFFLTLFLLARDRAARFSPSMDVIMFQTA